MSTTYILLTDNYEESFHEDIILIDINDRIEVVATNNYENEVVIEQLVSFNDNKVL